MHPDLSAYAGIYGIIAIILSDRLAYAIEAKRVCAANLQQRFDTAVLGLPTSSRQPRGPSTSEIAIAANTYLTKSGESKLKPWYPVVVDKVNPQQARAICQTTNINWDADLRQRYVSFLVVASGIATAVAFALGLHWNIGIERLVLAVAVPATPIWTLVLKDKAGHSAAISRLSELRGNADRLWTLVRSGADESEGLEASRELQDEIHEHRRASPLIFDWIYALRSQQQQRNADVAAQAMVTEILEQPQPTSDGDTVARPQS